MLEPEVMQLAKCPHGVVLAVECQRCNDLEAGEQRGLERAELLCLERGCRDCGGAIRKLGTGDTTVARFLRDALRSVLATADVRRKSYFERHFRDVAQEWDDLRGEVQRTLDRVSRGSL